MIGLVVITRLEKNDAIVAYQVDEAVLFGESSRPGSGIKVFERLRAANSGEWIAHDGLDEVEHPQGDAAIGFNPMAEIVAEFAAEDRLPNRPTRRGQAHSPDAGRRGIEGARCTQARGQGQMRGELRS